MATFNYKAKNAQGSVVSGSIAASSEQAFMDQLRQKKLILVSVQKQSIDIGKMFAFLNAKAITTKDITIFCRQFSVMISAGLPVLQGLGIIADQSENKKFGDILRKIKDDIGAGGTLGDAMGKYPKVFNSLFVNMIRSGETGGVLDVILERLSTYLEKAEHLKQKVKGAMMYPVIVMVIAISVVTILLVKVVPTFKDVFASFGSTLPGPTLLLVAVSDNIVKYLLIAAVGGGILFAGMKAYRKTEKGRLQLDGMLLSVPVLGMLLKKVAVARFTRTLGTLIKSGVPILEGLDTVTKTAGNAVVERAIQQARESVRTGEGLSEPLKRSKVFPPMVNSMVAVGEETGALDQMLIRAADFYDQEVDASVDGLTALIEPIVIVFLGITIGFIVVAMFLPMFDLPGIVGG